MSATRSDNRSTRRGKDEARAAFMKKNPGMFPDSVSKSRGHMGGCRTDGTHMAKTMMLRQNKSGKWE